MPNLDPVYRAHAPVLVTGVCGLIGSAVARELRASGVAVIGVDDLSAGNPERVADLAGDGFELFPEDVSDRAAMDRVLATGPVAVVHLAARVGVRRILAAPGACEVENIRGARVLAEAIAASGAPVRQVLAASTSEVYAESSSPLGEDAPLRPRRGRGRWRYAASKRVAEEAFDDLSRRAGIPVAHLRFFNVTGPGQDAASGMVLPRFVERARAGLAVEVYGSGDQVRTFAHVDAVARDVARLALAEAPVSGALNVGGSARTTIGALGELVVAHAGAAPGAHVLRTDPRTAVRANFEEVVHRVPDLSRLRGLGLGNDAWSLADIVDDMFARHGAALTPATLP